MSSLTEHEINRRKVHARLPDSAWPCAVPRLRPVLSGLRDQAQMVALDVGKRSRGKRIGSSPLSVSSIQRAPKPDEKHFCASATDIEVAALRSHAWAGQARETNRLDGCNLSVCWVWR